MALATKYNLELDQMNVMAAYLNGELAEELYLMPPDGVEVKPGHCWRLFKSLYGFKQAGRCHDPKWFWGNNMDSTSLYTGKVM